MRQELQGYSTRFSSWRPGVRAEHNSPTGVVVHGTSAVGSSIAVNSTI